MNETIKTMLANGEDFANAANLYNELETVQANICREDLKD